MCAQLRPAVGQGADPAQGQKPKLKTGQIDEKKLYKSGKGMFTVVVPAARNPFVRTYKFGEAQLKQGTADYEEVVFHIDDFGQSYGAGVHRIPPVVLEQMAKDGDQLTLANLADKTVLHWRDNYAEKPQSVEEASVQTQFGEGLFRIYVARNSSMLGRMTGTDASGKRIVEVSDAKIAVLVVRKADLYIYGAAEDESTMPGAAPLNLRQQLESFFASMTVKFE